jgi:type IV secretory pathway TrbF-like protein
MPNPTESSYIFSIAELVEFLDQYEQENSPFSKEAIAVAVKNRFVLSQNRSVYYNHHWEQIEIVGYSTASLTKILSRYLWTHILVSLR